MMKREKGVTIIELMILCIIILIFLSVGSHLFLNNLGVTERRATELANAFIVKHGIEVNRMSCAGDSDGDGYSTCNLLLGDGEKMVLACPSNYYDVEWFGATSCKEVYQVFNMMK